MPTEGSCSGGAPMTTPDKGLVSDLVVRIHLKLTASSQSKHFAWLEGELAQLVAHERDEAIVGAYRAAAAQVRSFNNAALCDLANEIEALPPQSALDAVERDRREIAETALQEMNEWCNFIPKPRKRLCRAWVNSDCGREHCQGFSGHKMHWYKIWSTGEVIYWAARGRIRGGKRRARQAE